MEPLKAKKYIGILFECCNVYRRIYINKDRNAYEGRCPLCYAKIKVPIGPQGTDQRIFKAR